MAHYAKIENGVVTQVIVADGPDWCEQNLGGEWVQTSYNTFGGVHSGGKIPLHKNYAGIGYTFDGVGFAAPQPYASWTKIQPRICGKRLHLGQQMENPINGLKQT
jgi:hypothetical protein